MIIQRDAHYKGSSANIKAVRGHVTNHPHRWHFQAVVSEVHELVEWLNVRVLDGIAITIVTIVIIVVIVTIYIVGAIHVLLFRTTTTTNIIIIITIMI